RPQLAAPDTAGQLSGRVGRSAVQGVNRHFFPADLKLGRCTLHVTPGGKNGNESSQGFLSRDLGWPISVCNRPPPSIGNTKSPGNAVVVSGSRACNPVVIGCQPR